MTTKTSQDIFTIFRNNSTEIEGNTKTLEDPQPISKEDSQSESRPTILIIDDDLHVRNALKLVFEKKYNLILCENGEAGIESLNKNVFAVILDIKMEGKNGFETFLEIKKKNLYLPIIFLTAYQDIKDPFEIMNYYRPFGYLIKGSDSKPLHDTVESAIDYYLQIDKNTFLVKALQSKNMVLQELRENLEATVDKRTEELTATIKGLNKEIAIRQKTEEEIKSLLKEKELILTEVHHRIKNNMTSLKSILSLQARMLKEPNAQNALQETENRIDSLMILYDKLYQSVSFDKISVKAYIPPLVELIVQNFPNYKSVSLRIKVEDFILDVKRLQPLGIIINELITNIMKHAFTNKTDGQILVEAGLKNKTQIDSSQNRSIAYLIVHDNGQGLSESLDTKKSKGFGLRLIELLITQLKGNMQLERKNGVRFILEFEL